MFNLNQLNHHKSVEEISDILSIKCDNKNKAFFRILVVYFLTVMASSMRAFIKTKDRGEIPINTYAIALATSGFGKGTSVNIMEELFLNQFKQRFLKETFHIIADKNLWSLAHEKSNFSGKDPEEEKEKLSKEFDRLGPPNFTFDSGSTPATKQLREKFIYADCGALSLQIDEIGMNLSKNEEVLATFLELYDKGLIKQKLTKQSNDNKRTEDLQGKTPANLLMFGTPSKLLDNGKTEQEFYNLLEMGYARRCLFTFGNKERISNSLTASEIYNKLTSSTSNSTIQFWSDHFMTLADPIKHNMKIELPDDVAIELLEYKIYCENLAEELSEYDEIKKSELQHRYFKALKLAGLFAFVDETFSITKEYVYNAVKLVEESGEAFDKILTREKSYVKLAKYIASSDDPLTHADLHEALPFYKSTSTARNEAMSLATAWGYKNCIIIKKDFVDNIELFSGESLKKTNTNNLHLSISNNIAYHYQTESVPFSELSKLNSVNDYHYCNHEFKNGHRSNENVLTGFNLVILDVDSGTTIEFAHDILKQYSHYIYATKRHTNNHHRFRIIMPIKYILHLDVEDYRTFMNNIRNWLPFPTDEASEQISKKYLTNQTDNFILHDGEILDPIKFIPRTSKNDQYNSENSKLTSLDSLEKWFAISMSQLGNRNNHFIKYAFALKDKTNMAYHEIENAILTFNKKLPNPLTEDELKNTVLQTIAKKFI